MDLTVGILSFNTRDLTLNCIRSIKKYTRNLKYEIIVVDNASRDGSASAIRQEFPEIKLVKNRENRFFAAGYNQIIKIAKGRYFIMLNSDTYLENNAFLEIIKFLKKHKVYVSEGIELRVDRTPILTGSRFRTLLSDFYELSIIGRIFKDKNYLSGIKLLRKSRFEDYKIEVGCNAYLCIDTDLLKKIGGYDEKFILYFTEDDLGKKIKSAGYKMYHCSKSYVIHYDAQSAQQLGSKRLGLFYRDMFTYHLKYSNKIFATLLYILLRLENLTLNILKFLKS